MTSKEFAQRLVRLAKRNGLRPDESLIASLWTYYDLLYRWSQRINLTALNLCEGGDSVFARLLIEPLIAARALPSGAVRLMDIGSGGGSPAIPMTLASPNVSLTMVESKVRKSVFLREAARQLNLFTTVVENARYEELLVRPDLHECADVVTVRAVRVEARVLLALQAFLRSGGLVFLFRGPTGSEIPGNIPPPLSWSSTVPLADSTRSRLVILQKTAPTLKP
jgi:16S rRNA (guanine527-N7)-methyltransferase